MSLKDELDLTPLKNAAVNWVVDILETELEAWPQIRADDDAILDVMAYALNQIKPRYYVTLLGNLYAQAPTDEQIEEVRTAVRISLEKISKDL